MSVEDRGLEELFRYYEKSVKYLPDGCFYDSIYIRSEYLDSGCIITAKGVEHIYWRFLSDIYVDCSMLSAVLQKEVINNLRSKEV